MFLVSLRANRVGPALIAGLLALGRLPRAGAQAPEPPPPPPAAPNDPAPEPLAERLRKLEEMNQRLLRQYDGIAKQNEALSRTVQDLSRKLEHSARPSGAPTARTGPTGPPLVGGISSPPSPAVSAERAARGSFDRIPLRAFADKNYGQRYGFVLQSEDAEFEIRFNGLLQIDSRIYQQPNQVPVISDIDIPRMRMYFSGRLTKPIEYQVSLQRSTNNLDILNAYLNFHYNDGLQVRIGRFRAPFTYEWAKLSIWEMLQPDRAPFALNFGPNRQVGAMAWGNVLENRLEYAAGIFDGPRNSTQDFNYAKDVMAFFDFRPFFQTADSPLKLLSVGGSVDAGRQNNPLSPALLRGSVTASTNTLTTGSGDSLIAAPFLAFNNNVRERGDRALWELHATYFRKGLSVLGAWDSGFNDFALTTPGARPVHLPVSGYHVQAGYIVTGETLEKRTLIEPLRPFDLRRGKFGLGALELTARFSELEVGRQVFTAGLADPNLWTNRLHMTDVGFNWYLNRYVKFYFDWQHQMFAQPVYFRPGPGLQTTSDLFWLRLQVWF